MHWTYLTTFHALRDASQEPTATRFAARRPAACARAHRTVKISAASFQSLLVSVSFHAPAPRCIRLCAHRGVWARAPPRVFVLRASQCSRACTQCEYDANEARSARRYAPLLLSGGTCVRAPRLFVGVYPVVSASREWIHRMRLCACTSLTAGPDPSR